MPLGASALLPATLQHRAPLHPMCLRRQPRPWHWGKAPRTSTFSTASRAGSPPGVTATATSRIPTSSERSTVAARGATSPPPNMAGAAVPSASVWFQYGGVVKVRFTSATRGWYLQAGELWSTNDGGRRWSQAHLGGIVTTLASSGNRVWALVDSCGGFPCASFHLFYRSTSDSNLAAFRPDPLVWIGPRFWITAGCVRSHRLHRPTGPHLQHHLHRTASQRFVLVQPSWVNDARGDRWTVFRR